MGTAFICERSTFPGMMQADNCEMYAIAGRNHVLCEKPLAPTKKQAEEMFATTEKNHVFLMEAFAYQHSPYLKEIEKEIEKGTIGEIRYMESAYITSDYNKNNIRMRKETLGGCTYISIV